MNRTLVKAEFAGQFI